jgi:carbamoyltransferase
MTKNINIVGISVAHDSSAALYTNGKLSLFFKEERLTRKKRDRPPFLSILEISKNFKEPIDAIIISSPTNGDPGNSLIADYASRILKCNNIIDLSDKHHLCHASLAFYNSGFDNANVIVVDRNGSIVGGVARESETIYSASYPNNFTEIYKNYWNLTEDKDYLNKVFSTVRNEKPNCEINYLSSFSITKVYETATTLIGQHMLENGKTMGLSAYGKIVSEPNMFLENGLADDFFFSHTDSWEAINKDHLDKINNNITESNHEFYSNYAYTVQKYTQDQVAWLVEKSIKKTGIKKICITGGYGLNVVCNGFLLNKFPNVEFYFEPIADDNGNSIGAAMLYYRMQTNDISINKIETTFTHGINHDLSKIEGIDCSVSDIANLIVNNKSVAIYNGLAESGPRALGNRSILYNALNKNAKTNVNIIKKREWYRPFAAAVLQEDAKIYFKMPIESSPYMTASFDINYEHKELLTGVMHVDGSCRIQTLDRSSEPIRLLLEEIKNISGHGIVLNTSFNLAGEPLVETPEEAISVLKSSDLDYIWFPEIQKLVSK